MENTFPFHNPVLVVLYLCQITARDIVGVVLYVEASVCFVAEYVKIFGIGLEGSVVDFLCFAFQVGYEELSTYKSTYSELTAYFTPSSFAASYASLFLKPDSSKEFESRTHVLLLPIPSRSASSESCIV